MRSYYTTSTNHQANFGKHKSIFAVVSIAHLLQTKCQDLSHSGYVGKSSKALNITPSYVPPSPIMALSPYIRSSTATAGHRVCSSTYNFCGMATSQPSYYVSGRGVISKHCKQPTTGNSHLLSI